MTTTTLNTILFIFGMLLAVFVMFYTWHEPKKNTHKKFN